MIKISDKLLNILNSSSGHMTADEIFNECQKSGVKASVASVYRALDELLEAKKITKISTPEGSDYYDKTLFKHYHLKCSKCGKIVDIEIPELESLLKSKVNGEITDVNLFVNYICNECKNK